MKGHVKIELFNQNNYTKETIEGDNLVTNALQILVNNCIKLNHVPVPDYIKNWQTDALGGLLLFDGPLEESTENVDIPGSGSHIIASVGRNNYAVDQNAYLHTGTLNAEETTITDTSVVNVWDFSTAQANGEIAALSLTKADTADSLFKYQYDDTPIIWQLADSFITSSSTVGKIAFTPSQLVLDSNTNTMYGYSRAGSNAAFIKAVKFFGYTDKITNNKFGDWEDVSTIKQVTTLSLPGELQNGTTLYSNDGNLYHITWSSNKVTIKSWKASDFSYTEQPDIVLNLNLPDRYPSINSVVTLQDGVLVLQCSHTSNDLCLYFVDIADPSHITTYFNITEEDAKSDSVYTLMRADRSIIFSSGVCFVNNVTFYDSTHNKSVYQHLLIYPKDHVISALDNFSNLATSLQNSFNYRYAESRVIFPRNLTPAFVRIFGSSSNTTYFATALPNLYLGTIYNLPSPITKTAAQTMKITYTLTME